MADSEISYKIVIKWYSKKYGPLEKVVEFTLPESAQVTGAVLEKYETKCVESVKLK